MGDDFDIQEYLANGVGSIVKSAIRISLKNPKEIFFMIIIPPKI